MFSILSIALLSALALSSMSAYAVESLSYSGRLVNATTGAPVTGTPSVKFDLVYASDSTTIICSKTMSVPLSNGVFHVNLNYSASECGNRTLTQVLEGVQPGDTLAYQVTDLTNGRSYGFQSVYSVPASIMSMMTKSLVQMGATDGQVLKWDDTLKKWVPGVDGAGTGTLVDLQAGAGISVSAVDADTYSVAITSGGVGTTQLANGAVTDIKIAPGITRAKLATGTPNEILVNDGIGSVTSMSPADMRTHLGLGSAALVNVGYSAGDVLGVDDLPLCTSAQKLRYTGVGPAWWICDVEANDSTKLDLAGGTMTGAINMNTNKITSLGAPTVDGDAANKKYVDDTISSSNLWTIDGTNIYRATGNVGVGVNPTTKLQVAGSIRIGDGAEICDATMAGAIRYSGSNIQFCAGAGWQTLGLAGSGISTLTGDVTASGNGSVAATIASGAVNSAKIADGTIATADLADASVTLAKIQNIATGRLLGRSSPSAGVVEELTVGTGLTLSAGELALSDTADDDSLMALGCTANKIPFHNGTSWTCKDALSTNTNSSVVVRDGSGGFEAGIVNVAQVAFRDGLSTINLQAPVGLLSNYVLTLPQDDGNSGQVLTSNGAGILTWTTPASAGITTLSGDVSATGPGAATATINNGAVTSAKIADATIVDADIANATITYSKLNIADAEIPSAKVNGLDSALAGKEPAITAGATTQYMSGNKTWQELNTDAVAEGSRLYFTDIRARAALSGAAPVNYDATTGVISLDTVPVTKGGTGLIATSPNAVMTTTSAGAYQNTTCADGDILQFSSTGVVCTAMASGSSDKLPLAGGTMTGAIAMGTNKITGVGEPTLAQDAATKNYVDAADATKLALAGGTMTGAIGMGTNLITGLGDPVAAQDAATKNYVDTVAGAINSNDKLPLAGGTMTGAIAMGTNKITGVGEPTLAQDAATKNYVDTVAGAINSNDKLPLAGGSMTGAIEMGTFKITGLGEPTLAQDAATKNYVETYVASQISAAGVASDTDGLPEGTTNLYYTDARARASLSGTAPINYNATTGVIALDTVPVAKGGTGLTTTASSAVMTTTSAGAYQHTTCLDGEIIQFDTLLGVKCSPLASGSADKLPLAGGTMTGAIAMGTNKITGLGEPTLAQDAATKNYVDTADATKLALAGGTMTGAIAMGTNKITGVGEPTLAQDAATKNYVDTVAGAINSNDKLPLAGGTMTGAIAMGTSKITGLGDPTVAQDAATKNYVDTQVSGVNHWTVNGSDIYRASGNVGIGVSVPNGALDVQGSIVMSGSTSGFAGFRVPAAAGSTVWQLPGADGASGQVLSTNGAGVLSWTTTSSGPADTDGLPEGATNLYYTDTRARASLSGTAPISYTAATGVIALDTVPISKGGTGLTTAPNYSVMATNAVGGYQHLTCAHDQILQFDTTNGFKCAALPASSADKLPLAGGTMSGVIAMGANQITGLADPTLAQDAATKNYVDTVAGAINSNDKLPLAGGTMSGAIAMGANLITGVADPIAAQDAATKNYVDTQITGTTLWTASGSDIYRGSGNVGIGTTAPQSILDIHGSADATAPLVLRAGNGGGQYGKSQVAFGWNGSTAGSFTNSFRHSIKTRHDGNSAAGNAMDFYMWNHGVDGSAALGTKHVMSLLGNGNVGIGTTVPNGKLDVKGSVVMSGSTSGFAGFRVPAAAGSTVWELPAADGTSGQVLSTSGAGVLSWITPSAGGITSLNGLTAATQTFGTIGTAGTAPAWTSSTSAHTLNIPMASAAGVTAGLLSKTEYDALNAKEGSITAGTTAQYYRGDKTWQTLNTDIVPEGATNKYYSDTLAQAAIAGTAPINYDQTTGVIALDTVPVSKGGTGLTTAPANRIMATNASGAYQHLLCAHDQLLQFDTTNGFKCANLPAALTNTFVQDGNSFGANAVLGTNDAFPLIFETNGTEKMTILANGSVGVGTSTPLAKFHVNTVPADLPGQGYNLGNWKGTGAQVPIFSKVAINNGGSTPAVAQPAMVLAREGVNAQSYANVAEFNLSRYENFSDNARTRFDIALNDRSAAGTSPVMSLIAADADATIGTYPTMELKRKSTLGVSFPQMAAFKLGRYKAPTAESPDTRLDIALKNTSSQTATADVTVMTLQSNGNVGIGTNAPSSILDISSTSSGILIPRMTTSQRDAISAIGRTGMQVYNVTTNELNYHDGTSWKALGVSGAGITSFNGLTTGTQTLAIGTAGTAPAWNSTGSAHTLNIPMASATGVTAGLLSKTQYDALNAKEGSITAGTTAQYYRGDKTWQTLNTDIVPAGATNKYYSDTLAQAALTGTAPINYDQTTGVIALDTVPVSKGGTGLTTAPANRIMATNASGAYQHLLCAHDQLLQFDTTNGFKCATLPASLTSAFVQNGNGFGANAVLGTNDAFPLIFETNGTEKMSILANGNVGIGTTNPYFNLDVQGNDQNVTLNVQNHSSTTARFPGFNINNYSGGLGGGPTFTGTSYRGNASSPQPVGANDLLFLLSANGATTAGSYNTSTAAQIQIQATDIYSSTELGSRINFLTTPNNGNTLTTQMTIDQNGHVGIGTTTPSSNLHVESVTNARLRVGNSDPTGNPHSSIELYNYRGNWGDGDPSFASYVARGTKAAPARVTAGMKIMSLQGRGFAENTSHGSNRDGASIDFIAATNWGNSNVATDMVFSTGRSGSWSNEERMRISSIGNVGIGTPTPAYPLSIYRPATGVTLNLESGSAGSVAQNRYSGLTAGAVAQIWGAGLNITNGDGGYEVYDYSAGASRLFINTAGRMGIGTLVPSEKLEVTGNVRATSFITTSDKRLKENVQVVKGLPLILQLRGVTYDWKSDGSQDMGVIAQEVEAIFPWAVATDKNTGFKAVKYQSLIAPLIESVKDLDKKDKEISRKIASLEERNSELEMKNEELEQKTKQMEELLQNLASRLEKMEKQKK